MEVVDIKDGNILSKNCRPGLVKKCRVPRFPRAFLNGPRWAKIGKNKQISTVLSTKNEDRH